jgi:threonine synthase
MVRYISTRGQGKPRTFEEVLLEGLAPDSGLYLPDTWPQLDIKFLKGKSYADIAEAVMYPFVEGSIDRKIFRELTDDTYNEEIFRADDITPLKEIYPGLHIMELFHGPTIAFKDIALQFLGRLFDYVLHKKNEKITIVGATSGDTGSAAIEGCYKSDRVNIFILYPHGRVSDVQRRQMTTVKADNVHCIAVEGTFDDCQGLVKSMFADQKFREQMRLSAVNSINWARIMAQIVYYVKASLEYPDAAFVVPTGNFGNVFAAYVAKKMGAPLGELCVATNRNDILTRFFETGEMKQEGVNPTISPSMDIQISSNFERYLFDVFGRDASRIAVLMEEFKTTGRFVIPDSDMTQVKKGFTAARSSEDETLATMKKIYAETKYVLDPHSAVGVSAALKINKPVITMATAHPAKFPDAVEKATGICPALPEHLKGLREKPENFEVLPSDLNKIRNFITSKA